MPSREDPFVRAVCDQMWHSQQRISDALSALGALTDAARAFRDGEMTVADFEDRIYEAELVLKDHGGK